MKKKKERESAALPMKGLQKGHSKKSKLIIPKPICFKFEHTDNKIADANDFELD